MALSLPAGLPSSVLFLCIRHADCRDQSQAQSLPAAAVAAMKTALKVRVEEEILNWTLVTPPHSASEWSTVGLSTVGL